MSIFNDPKLRRTSPLAAGLGFICTQLLLANLPAFAQNATVTNNAAPNANVSTNTSGGTNINQQLNNVFDTSYGFGPGIICRTPQIVMNGTYGGTNSNLNTFPTTSGNSQNAASYSGGISIAIPFGSSVIRDCERYAGQIAEDREISSELSLIRACNQIKADKLTINPEKYPRLAKCLDPVATSQPTTSVNTQQSSTPSATTSPPQIPPKVLQRFNP